MCKQANEGSFNVDGKCPGFPGRECGQAVVITISARGRDVQVTGEECPRCGRRVDVGLRLAVDAEAAEAIGWRDLLDILRIPLDAVSEEQPE